MRRYHILSTSPGSVSEIKEMAAICDMYCANEVLQSPFEEKTSVVVV